MKKKILISVSIVLFIAAAIAVYFIQTNVKIATQKESARIAAASESFDMWMNDHLYASENYTITLEIPEEKTGNRFINLDSLATAPFFSWLDKRLYEGPSTLTIKVSKATSTASFDDGTEVYFLWLYNGDVHTYFPRGDGSYDAHALKNPKAAKYVDAILFSKDQNLFKSNLPPEDVEMTPGHIALTRKIDSTPFLGSFSSGDNFPTPDAIKVSMEAIDSPEPTLTMTCEFSKLLADISALLYNEDYAKNTKEIGNYHLNITVDAFDQTEPVVLPTNRS